MELLGAVVGVAVGFLFLCIGLLKWNDVRYRRKGLPPGTMGWPLLGETTEFLKQGEEFLKNKRARHGDLFKSHILGCPAIISMDPEINRTLLLREGKGINPGYPQSMQGLLGESNISFVQGPLHKTIRNATLRLVGPSMIPDHLLPKMDQYMRRHLRNWSDKIIDIQEKTKELWLISALSQIASIENGPAFETLKSEIHTVVEGTFAFPINFPGTNYHTAFQARKKIVKILKNIIDEKRASPGLKNDFLDALLRNQSDDKLTDEQIIDLLVGIIYAGYETVSTTTMMTVKLLHDHPKVLEEIRNEHLEIRRGKQIDEAINWNDYKSMRLTRAVILETSRLAAVVHGVLRTTTHDFNVKGFTIPKGWMVYLYFAEINFDSSMYSDPLRFDPWRWLDNNRESHPYFFAFGGGARLCPGKEWGMVEISTFLHYFLTQYRWTEIEGERFVTFPRIEAPKGLHIRVWDY